MTVPVELLWRDSTRQSCGCSARVDPVPARPERTVMAALCCNALMHLNPYGEYAVLLAASLANEWPTDRSGIVARTREFGMTMSFATGAGDHGHTRAVIDDWLKVVDAAPG